MTTLPADFHHVDCDYRNSVAAKEAADIWPDGEAHEIHDCNLSCADGFYIDGEGIIWDWDYARCPRCNEQTQKAHYHFTTMTSWLCPACGVMYDEPTFAEPEVAFVGALDDEQEGEA